MKLYPIPGGDWAGTEADWRAAMKAKGLNPKDFEATKTREVPTGKKELMEFLTFFAVDVYRTGDSAPTPKADIVVDHAALQARHNPDAPDLAPGSFAAAIAQPGVDDGIEFVPPKMGDMDAAFDALPVQHQLALAVVAIDAAGKLLRDNKLA